MNVTRSGSALLLTTVLMLGACGGGGDGVSQVVAPPIAGCSVTEQNQFVIDLMRDIYFWVDELPASISAADYNSPEETMAAIQFSPLDRFSGIRDQAANDAFFSESQFIGVGITLSFTDDDRVFLSQVFGDGPAAAAGLVRGDEILSINGQNVSTIIAAGDSVSAAFGDNEVGVNVDIRYRDMAGSLLDVSFAKALVTIETVTTASVIQVNNTPTAYLGFRNFVTPSFEALNDAFELFAAEGATEMILDVRYNGGGLISVAEFLSSLIGGSVTDGSLFTRRQHNQFNTNFNEDTLFTGEVNALNLNKLVVITTGSSASASELVINGLRPFLDVTLVGEKSFGKPVGSYGYDFCDKTAVPIAFNNVNANGFGDYFDGFEVDCPATDDLTQPLGSELEGMLAEAITVMSTGSCSTAAVQAKSQGVVVSKARNVFRQEPEFRGLVGAY
ncbi:MAG: S41 family peptidase [Gammaproteobacteria bacterium]